MKKFILTDFFKAKAHEILIGLILVFLAFFVWQKGIGILSSYTDMSFHLATAQGFVRAGGIVSWDFWESLPIGRPHNYPPLFHLILASFIKTGLNPTVAYKLMMELTLVGGLIIFEWSISKLFNKKVALWSLIFLFPSYHFIQLSITVLPSTFAVFLSPLLLYFAINNRWLSYSSLLAILFYLHLFVPYMAIMALLFYLLAFNRKSIVKFLIYTLISFILYLPWLTHIFQSGWEYIKYLDQSSTSKLWNDYVDFNLVLIILALAGLIIWLRSRSIDRKYLFIICAAILIILPSFMLGNRVINGHLLVFLSVLSAMVLSILWETYFFKLPILLLVAFYISFTPTFSFGNNSKLTVGNWMFFLSERNEDSIIATPDQKFRDAILAIKKNAKPGEAIITNLKTFDGQAVNENYLLSISNLIGSYCNLSTLNLREPEIYKRSKPMINQGKFILTDNATDTRGEYKMISQLRSDNEGDNWPTYVLYNSNLVTAKETIPRYKFPLWAGNLILVSFIAIILIDSKKGFNRRNVD